MPFKQHLAKWVRQFWILRWGIRLAVKILVPRHFVGAVGAVFNEEGQVLLVEHVFRPHYPWGLPGGWVEHHEHPADTVRRELQEELNMDVEIGDLLLCELQGAGLNQAPPGLSLAYFCRVGNGRPKATKAHDAYEVLAIEWVDPLQISHNLLPFQHKAILLGQQAFERERRQP